VPGGGSAGVGVGVGCACGDAMAGPDDGGGKADGVTGWAVVTPGDGSAGNVVTDTTGVGAGVPAARDVVVDCPSANAITQQHAAIAVIEILVMPSSPGPERKLAATRLPELRSGATLPRAALGRYISRARIRSRSPGAI
jgi:hypothetical protein